LPSTRGKKTNRYSMSHELHVQETLLKAAGFDPGD